MTSIQKNKKSGRVANSGWSGGRASGLKPDSPVHRFLILKCFHIHLLWHPRQTWGYYLAQANSKMQTGADSLSSAPSTNLPIIRWPAVPPKIQPPSNMQIWCKHSSCSCVKRPQKLCCLYSPIEYIHRHAMCFSLKFPVNLSFRPSVWVNNTNGLKSWNSLITHFLQLKKGNNVKIFHILMLSDAKTDPV